MYITVGITITTYKGEYTLTYTITEDKGAHNMFLYPKGSDTPLLEMASVEGEFAMGKPCILRGYRNYMLPTTMTSIDMGTIRNIRVNNYEKKAA